MVCGLTDSALSEADTTDNKKIDKKMSATATTTFSDTLVVGRQPQQSVGLRSVSPSSPLPLHPFHIPGPFSPSSTPIAARKSNGLDPQFTSANRPGRVRFSPRTAKQTRTIIRPRPPPPSVVCGLLVAAPLHGRQPCFLVVWNRVLPVVIVRCMWKRRSIRRLKGWFACGQRGGNGRIASLTNERVIPFLPPLTATVDSHFLSRLSDRSLPSGIFQFAY